MPPRLPRVSARQLRLLNPESRRLLNDSKCLICQLWTLSNSKPVPRQRQGQPKLNPLQRGRRQSSTTSKTNNDIQLKPVTPKEAAEELRKALVDLQKHARSYVNISRLQLALRGIEQQAGNETIRVAILALNKDGKPSKKTREFVRLLLADPLKEEEEWETVLTSTKGPLLLKIGDNLWEDSSQSGISNRLIRELRISSQTLNSRNLEIFVLDTDLQVQADESPEEILNRLLVPIMDIPISATGRYTPITMPVHKAIIVGEGITGAASLLQLPFGIDHSTIMSTVDLAGYVHEEDQSLPFQAIDVTLGNAALFSFRESVDNAMSYEHHWFASNLPAVSEWLKAGTSLLSENAPMKEPVHHLIASVLSQTAQKLSLAASREESSFQSSRVPHPTISELRSNLKLWAETAHTELRDQLDLAFAGSRWKALSWYKLFWRVDDVGHMATDILSTRFLLSAEQTAIHLAGQIEGAGVFKTPALAGPAHDKNWAYKEVPEVSTTTVLGTTAPAPNFKELVKRSDPDTAGVKITPQPWPLHIPLMRSYLALETIPRLQALAQKLVLQTLSTSGFSTAFGALMYFGSISTTVYEAGAVAALGCVWSLRSLQNRWERARGYWEGEVREEGRRAVRSVEGAFGDVLKTAEMDVVAPRSEEIEEARRAVERTQRWLDVVDGKKVAEELEVKVEESVVEDVDVKK